MYPQSFLVTSVRGIALPPITAASAALGIMGFMNAALGFRLLFLAVFFAALLGAFFAFRAFLFAAIETLLVLGRSGDCGLTVETSATKLSISRGDNNRPNAHFPSENRPRRSNFPRKRDLRHPTWAGTAQGDPWNRGVFPQEKRGIGRRTSGPARLVLEGAAAGRGARRAQRPSEDGLIASGDQHAF